jgi:hypothetical protein
MEKLHSQIKGQLERSNQKYKDRVDQNHRELQFEVGRYNKFKGTYNKLKMKKI